MKNITTIIQACLFLAGGLLSAQTPQPLKSPVRPIVTGLTGFQENKGQVIDLDKQPADNVLFKMTGNGIDVYVTEKGLSYFFYDLKDVTYNNGGSGKTEVPGHQGAISWERVDMHLKNATIKPSKIKKTGPYPGHTNYFLSHCPGGITHVGIYQTITFSDVYPGIDWVLYNRQEKGFKYDFIVHPGADAGAVKLIYSGLSAALLQNDGSIKLQGKSGSITENSPFVYSEKSKREIKSAFHIVSSAIFPEHVETTVGFELGDYDAKSVLVIDPQLVWATPFGGSFVESIQSISHDKHGNSYAVGLSQSVDFPVQSAGTYFQGTVSAVGFQPKAIIMKFNRAGVLKWSTYYGGSTADFAYSVTCDSLANVFVSGGTNSADFPVKDTGTFFQGTYAGQSDGFILKFDSLGNRIWASYYGGSQLDWFYSLSCDREGNVYASGITYSADFPMKNAGGFFDNTPKSPGHNSGTVAKFSNDGTLIWATYFKSDRTNAISAADDGYVYITGFTYDSIPVFNPGNGAFFKATGTATEAYIAKFHSSTSLVWSTYYGGSKEDYGRSILADKKGNVFMCGVTRSKNLPVLGPENTFQDTMSSNSPVETDCFITKFGPNGALLWATYFGAVNYDEMSSWDNLALDACDRVYVSMEVSGAGAPLMASCEGGYSTGSNGAMDEVIARFSNHGTLEWGTYLGGASNDTYQPLEIDLEGNLLTGGQWDGGSSAINTHPVVNPGGGALFNSALNGMSDGFIAKFSGGVIDHGTPPFTYSALCAGQSGTLVPTLSSAFVSGGQFRAQGITIDPNTGQVVLNNAPVGIYPVSYAWKACQCNQARSFIQVVDCSALSEQQNGTDIEVFSNPNNGHFDVRATKPLDLKLCDEFGRVQQSVKLNAQNNFKQTVSVPVSGIYILSGSGVFKKVVVIR